MEMFANRKLRKTLDLLGHRVLVTVLTLLFFFPFIWVILLSLRESKDIFSSTFRLFTSLTLENYQTVFTELGFASLLVNSMTISFLATLVGLLLGVPAGFAIARWKVGGKGFLLWIITLRLFPTITIILPAYFIFQSVGLVDTLFPLVIMLSFISLPLIIWLSHSFFLAIPGEIEDAARIDGCSSMQVLLRIAIPMISPGLTVSVLFSFVYAWNNFLIPLIFTFQNWQTVTLGSSQLITMIQVRWGAAMAASVLALAPILLMVVLAKDRLMRGFIGGTR